MVAYAEAIQSGLARSLLSVLTSEPSSVAFFWAFAATQY